MKPFLLSNKKYVIENQNQLTHLHGKWASVSGQAQSKNWCGFAGIFAHLQNCKWASLKARTGAGLREFLPTYRLIFLIFFEMNENDFYFCFCCFVQFFEKVGGKWAKITAKQELTRLWGVPTYPKSEWAEWASSKLKKNKKGGGQ